MRKHPVLISLLLTAAVCSAAVVGAALTASSTAPEASSADGSVETTGPWSPVVYWNEWPDGVTAAPAVTTEATATAVAPADLAVAEQGRAAAGAASAAPSTGKTTVPSASKPGPVPAPAPAPAPTPPPAPPAPAAPEVIGGYGASIASYINPSATYDSTLQSQCIAQAKRMALAGALSHSSYAPESCASFGDGMTAVGGGGGGVAGALYGHCPQLGSCSRLGVGLVLYNGTLWAVAQGGE